jgi:hypothetical protein
MKGIQGDPQMAKMEDMDQIGGDKLLLRECQESSFSIILKIFK